MRQELFKKRVTVLLVNEDKLRVLMPAHGAQERRVLRLDRGKHRRVAEVVLNRMLSDYFPDTVEEVVFQKYGDVWQFSPAPYLYSAEPDKEQYLAVHTAIEEREHILSEDTVYFSTAPYNESVDMIIGNHYFCKIF